MRVRRSSDALIAFSAARCFRVAQGKADADIATILGCAENTVKVHIARIFEKLGFENRNAATVRALEILSSPKQMI